MHGEPGSMRLGIKAKHMKHITVHVEVQFATSPLGSCAMRHRSDPREHIVWQVDRNCRVVTFKREVRHG